MASERPGEAAVPQPAQPSGTAPHQGAVPRRVGKTRNPWGVWLLALVTLSVYFFVWYFKINREQRDYDSDINVDPTTALLAVLLGSIFLGIFAWVSTVRCGYRIQQAEKTSGANERNKVWDRYGNPEEGTVI
jgi:RsiW-degrading membrane proteinase PrsW (M82 family)